MHGTGQGEGAGARGEGAGARGQPGATTASGLSTERVLLPLSPPPLLQKPPQPAAFRAELDGLFRGLDADYLRSNTPEVINKIMDAIREHQVGASGSVDGEGGECLPVGGWACAPG